MAAPNLRIQARECLSRARCLLQRNDEPSIRYACLELRFAVELIVANQLSLYREEVLDSTLDRWTPRELITEMRLADVLADQSVSVEVGLSLDEMHSLGTDHRLSEDWVAKIYNTLGSLLHIPTLKRLLTASKLDVAAITGKALKIVEDCERVLDSPVFNVKFGGYVELTCVECGSQIRRNRSVLVPGEGVRCRKSDCRAIYDIAEEAEQQVMFVLRKALYRCKRCGADNLEGVHRYVVGTILTCRRCQAESQVALGTVPLVAP